MSRPILLIAFVFFCSTRANAQLGVIKLVGKDTGNYPVGFAAFIKSAFPVSDGSDATLEIGANIFPSNDGQGTIMCPLKLGYRYTFDRTGTGFYVEPQAGYNLFGITSLYDANGYQVNLKYHGVVFAIGTGYLFSALNAPFDLNLRYETVIDHGGSNNLISLGISRFIRFGKRASED